MEKLNIPGKSNSEIKKTAFKYAVKNAFEHKGKAQIGAVVGKVKALFPDLILGEAMPTINEAMTEANSLGKKELEENYNLFNEAGWELKHEEKEKTLPELNWLKKGEKIITRVAPNPSGAMHFGHARPAILSDEYVKKYGGKLFVRFDDTDPKIKKPLEGIEKEFLEEFKWLGIKVAGTSNASNNLKKYYKIIETLLADNKAYICFCKPEDWREKVWKSTACPCRDKTAKEQLKYWKEMLKWKLKEGSCVVRLKTDLKDKDSSVRDWWLARIVDNVEHPNKKVLNEHVWPSYNLASAVDDYYMGINFIIRGQEHIQNEKKQRYLYDYFKWQYPHTAYHGKIAKVGDMILSKSKIKEMMEKGGLERDDDPRLATLKSFRRRGFKPETIRKIIFELGLNPNDAKIGIENFAAINKTFLGEVKAYPFIEDGAEIEIINILKGKINAYGSEITIDKAIMKFIVDKKEIAKFKSGEIIRMKDGFNIKLTEVSEYGAKANFVSYEKSGYKTINWLVEGQEREINVLVSDGKEKVGMSVSNISKEKENTIVNLINLGYVNIEENNEKTNCVFAHE